MNQLDAYIRILTHGSLTDKLNALAELREARTRQVLDLEAQTHTLQAKIAERVGMLDSMLAALEIAIKTECVQVAETVKGAQLQVVYSKGRTTWDTAGLEGYALEHPEIRHFRKNGDPSAKIVEVK